MKMRTGFIPLILLLTAIAFSCSQSSDDASEWPQYLGPDRNSTSAQKGILRSWPENGPEVIWTANVGIGFGGPVIKDGKVYLLDRNEQDGKDIFRCFDFSNGKELWKYTYDAPGTVQFPGSRSVPAIDGNLVYSCGQNGDLYCFDVKTHQPVWHKNVWTDFGGGRLPTWAISQNPLIYGDLLIIASQAPEAGVVAYNKLTGDIAWKTPSLGAAGYVSPSIVKISGEDHVVMVTASENPFDRMRQRFEREGPQGPQRQGPPSGPPPQRNGQTPQGPPQGPPPGPPQGAAEEFVPEFMGKVVGIKPLSGEILWEFADWECHIPVPSAFDAGENRVLVIAGYELGTLMLKVEKGNEGKYKVTELFRHNEFGDQTKPPIMHNGYFYAQFSTNSIKGGLACMNIQGKVLWKTMRKPLFDKGSMILADGLILATDGRKSLYLIEPDTTGFKALASAELLGEGGTGSENDRVASMVGGSTQNWGPLALADGKLLIRDQSRMLCLKVAK